MLVRISLSGVAGVNQKPYLQMERYQVEMMDISAPFLGIGFKAAIDQKLKEHILSAKANATYQ